MTTEKWKSEAVRAFESSDRTSSAMLAEDREFPKEFPCGVECCGMEAGPLHDWAREQGILEFLLESMI